jgi:hypothetical protein
MSPETKALIAQSKELCEDGAQLVREVAKNVQAMRVGRIAVKRAAWDLECVMTSVERWCEEAAHEAPLDEVPSGLSPCKVRKPGRK